MCVLCGCSASVRWLLLCLGTEKCPLTPINCSDAECLFEEELLLRAALCEDESESVDDRAEADPVRDDLYFRLVRQSLRQASRSLGHDRFLPRHWTPEEALRVRTIYLGSRRRPWYRELHRLSTKALSSPEEAFDIDFLSWFVTSVPSISAESGEPRRRSLQAAAKI